MKLSEYAMRLGVDFNQPKIRGGPARPWSYLPPMRTKLAIAVLAPLVFVGGCGGSDHAAKFDGPVVPWSARQPSELAERPAVPTPCRASDLAVHAQVNFEAYGNGGGIAVIALEHKGKQDCRLDGT